MINKNSKGEELHFAQNLIVIAGPFADGKTHTIGRIHRFFSSYGLWYGDPITDATYIEEALEADHRYNDGVNHMHEDQEFPQKHEHNLGEKNLHFSVTGSYVPHYMHKRLFDYLSTDLWTNRLFPVEWSGGENTNSDENPASHADYSFRSQVEGMRSGIYASGWLSRVLLVIHPYVKNERIREELNERRKLKRDPTDAEIASGMGSWWIPESGMKITGRNDFPSVIPTLERMGLSGKIYQIQNDGGIGYDRELDKVLEKTVGSLLRAEGLVRIEPETFRGRR